jgi:hypothetical protein
MYVKGREHPGQSYRVRVTFKWFKTVPVLKN